MTLTTENQYDSVMVANIDVGCTDVTEDIVKVSNRIADEDGAVSTQIYDKHETWNHADYFQVKFDGKPYSIAPGKTKLLPRFIAEHFAKHLADHILQKKEIETGRRGLVQSPVERPKLINEILTEVNADIETPPPPQAETEVDSGPVEDAGVVPNTAVGDLKPEPPTLEEIMKVAGEDPNKVDKIPIEETSITDEKKPTPTRKQLIELCYQQNIDITGTENKAQLIEKLLKG